MIRPFTRPARRFAAMAAALLFAAGAAAAQDVVPDTLQPPPVVEPELGPAPAAVPVVSEAPPLPAAQTVVWLEPPISPRAAFVRSLVVPGWGQSSLGAHGRGGVYFALEAGSLWMVYKSQRKLEDARRLEEVLHATGQLPANQRTALVNSRRAQREDWITLSLFWLFFSGADAFVAAHLWDFDERIEVRPTPEGALELGASVPLRRP